MMKFYPKRGIWTIATAVAVMVVMCWSCSGNKTESSINDVDSIVCDSDSIDSVAIADTLALDDVVKAGKIPPSMDETFDDFIFAFDKSNRMQRERTCFPLPYHASDNDRKYTRAEWNHHSVFMGQDFSVSLWNNSRQMSMARDTALLRVCLQQIHLKKQEMTNYHFSRSVETGKWMLDSIGETSLKEHKLSDFLEFLGNWVSDSTYQKAHLAQTINYKTLDDDSEEMVVGTIDAAQWNVFAPAMPKDDVTCIDYGQLYTDRQHVMLQMRGFNNGLESTFTFERKNDSWELTGFEN